MGLGKSSRMELLSFKDSWRHGGQVGAGLVSSRNVRQMTIPQMPRLPFFLLELPIVAGPCHFPRGHCPRALLFPLPLSLLLRKVN